MSSMGGMGGGDRETVVVKREGEQCEKAKFNRKWDVHVIANFHHLSQTHPQRPHLALHVPCLVQGLQALGRGQD